jgi:type IV secretory pathway VirD2 relaxase
VLIKPRLVNLLRRAAPDSTQTHLEYLGREGVTKDGSPTAAYGPEDDQVDVDAFEARGRPDRHQFRFIVSSEDAVDPQDLPLGTRLE